MNRISTDQVLSTPALSQFHIIDFSLFMFIDYKLFGRTRIPADE